MRSRAAWGRLDLVRLALVTLALLALARPGLAFECKTPVDRPELSLWWQTRQLEFGVRATSGLDPEVVRAAFDVWAAPGCSDLEFRYVGLVAGSDPINQVFVVDAGWGAEGRPLDAVAITETSFRPNTGVIERANIEVNEESFVFGDAEVSCAGGLYDLKAVITHEVGHFLGLGHTQAFSGLPTDPTMAPRVDACETDKRDLEDDDVNGLCFLYPAQGPTGRCGGLPDAEANVSNVPFGCRAGPRPGEGALFVFALTLALTRRRFRR